MTNFRKLFEPENFETKSFDYFHNTLVHSSKVIKTKDAAEVAQSILNEALDKATVVYEKRTPADSQPFSIVWSTYETDKGVISNKNTGMKALLIQVEPIKECEHKIDDVVVCSKDDSFGYAYYKCLKCKKELIPTGFKVKE
ncbi:MAG TPA: hypothetical protein V6C58_24675 [Allocoleopsis sp.]